MKLLLALALILSSMSAAAQARVTGTSASETDKSSIHGITVSLFKRADSGLVKMSVTDSSGLYNFDNLKAGQYFVMGTGVGLTSNPVHFTVDSTVPFVHLPVLLMARGAKEMKAVTVMAKKPFLEQKLDKLILNPDALISAAGSTAMEVLEKAPGVTVDKDGNISLKGKQGVIVMIDGKQSYMSAQDLATYLQNTPASSLEQIEVMTNPSAKYDAAGNSGVINLKTKKNKQKGFNGGVNLSYGQGIFAKTNNSFNLNVRSGKFNVFINGSGNYRKNSQDLDIYRRYSNADKSTKANFSQNTKKQRNSYYYNGKAGVDYYATKKTTIGVVVGGYFTKTDETGSSYSYPRNSESQLDSIVAALRSEVGTWRHQSYNLNFQHNFDSAGRQLTADADYLRYASDRTQEFDNYIYNTDWTTRYYDKLTGDLPSIIEVYSAKLDYTHPLKKELKIESGIKWSNVRTDNHANYYNIFNNVKTVDINKTNRFEYNEMVNAGYVNLSKAWKKWSVQAGLRIENTSYSGHQFGNQYRPEMDSLFKRTYTNAFPTAYASYKANDKHQFGFSLGRRIDRPDYEDLNPFLFFLDKYTYEEGNPFLRPMYSDLLEASHIYKQLLTTTVSYTHTTDLFTEAFRQNNQPDDSIATVVTKANYGVMNNLTLSMNAQVKVQKWWNAMIYGEGRYQEFKGMLNGENAFRHGYTFIANVNNQFSFRKGWSAELSGFFRSSAVEGQMLIKSMSQMDLGVKKDILKNKGSLKFAIRDLYGPRVVRGQINFQNTEARFQQQNDSRVATLSFSYRFGKPIKSAQKRKTGGASEEQNRIKSGS